MEYLYIDGTCGISGDMVVASLIDLGANTDKLIAAINSLGLSHVHVHIEKKNSYSIAGLSFKVQVHEHDANHVHIREEGYVNHSHRTLTQVYEILERAKISENAMNLARKIFDIIANAESKAHGVNVQEVHFHEVGAVDSIIDILAVAVLVDDLKISNCIVTGFNEGYGFVNTQHGALPIPVIAVENIAEQFGIALHITKTCGEMITPTGIAIAAALRTSETLPLNFKILKSGIGIGSRDFGRANFLRAQIIKSEVNEGNKLDDCNVFILECNIDDSTPEELGYAMQKIFDAGARDVYYIPCVMKKNRPGVLLRAIADVENLVKVENAILLHTSTVGLRRFPVSRNCMSRTLETVQTEFGNIIVKKCKLGEFAKYKPEFESVKAAAEKFGTTYSRVFDAAKIAIAKSEC